MTRAGSATAEAERLWRPRAEAAEAALAERERTRAAEIAGARAEARTAERARILEMTDLGRERGHPELALALAVHSDVSIAEAAACMDGIPPTSTPVPPLEPRTGGDAPDAPAAPRLGSVVDAPPGPIEACGRVLPEGLGAPDHTPDPETAA